MQLVSVLRFLFVVWFWHPSYIFFFFFCISYRNYCFLFFFPCCPVNGSLLRGRYLFYVYNWWLILLPLQSHFLQYSLFTLVYGVDQQLCSFISFFVVAGEYWLLYISHSLFSYLFLIYLSFSSHFLCFFSFIHLFFLSCFFSVRWMAGWLGGWLLVIPVFCSVITIGTIKTALS